MSMIVYEPNILLVWSCLESHLRAQLLVANLLTSDSSSSSNPAITMFDKKRRRKDRCLSRNTCVSYTVRDIK